MQEQKITEQEFKHWQRDPVTKRMYALLELTKKHKAVMGLALKESTDETAMNTARCRGYLEALDMLSDAELFDTDQLEENINVRVDSSQ